METQRKEFYRQVIPVGTSTHVVLLKETCIGGLMEGITAVRFCACLVSTIRRIDLGKMTSETSSGAFGNK